MITYERLWETMKTKKVSQYRLIEYHKFSAGQIGRLKKNSHVSTHTIETLCKLLDCEVEDIMEFRPDGADIETENGKADCCEQSDDAG